MWTIWLGAFAILLALTIAVVRNLSTPTHAMGAHDAMTMGGTSGMSEHGTAAALTRLGSAGTVKQLLGSSLLTVWQLNSVAVAFVVLLGAWYLTGVVKARSRAGGEKWPLSRVALFFGGLALCVIATCGSIGVYDQAFFSAHMLGHLIFVMGAPVLLMAGRPIELSRLASNPRDRARIDRVLNSWAFTILTAPPVVLASYTAVIVGSHLTGLMDTIMRNDWAGQVEHLVYLLVGCQFFLLVLGDAPIRWKLSTPARWLLLAISMAVDTFVGLVLLQGNHAVAMLTVPGLYVNPLSDTHTGGSIMWFGGDAIMAAVMIGLVMGWLRDPERQRRDTGGWMERARRANFADHAGAGQGDDVVDDLDFDDQDARLVAYNKWLAEINSEGH
ncbi:MAG: cytochrome c oxidase assembly protein [Frankiales bacterium]|nr:cytochrome c oxidase assembly protein [Frankiales bacterium]